MTSLAIEPGPLSKAPPRTLKDRRRAGTRNPEHRNIMSGFETLIGEILGQHLKLGKGGIWMLEGVQIPTGPDGFTFTALAATAAYGRVKFEDDFPAEKSLQLFADGFPRFGEELPDG